MILLKYKITPKMNKMKKLQQIMNKLLQIMNKSPWIMNKKFQNNLNKFHQMKKQITLMIAIFTKILRIFKIIIF